MASVTTTSAQRARRGEVPQLANGDRLTRAEFERRYAAMPEGIKAELIEGIVYMSPPVRFQPHSEPQALLITWLGYYVAKTPGLRFGDNGTVRLDKDNEPQPDLFLILPPHLGGRAIIDADGYIAGPPAFVCEIAASSVNIDLHSKKETYCRHGVQEYLVWRTEDAAIDWFAMIDGDFRPIATDSDGTIRSRAFPGLWLLPSALLAADLPALFALLDRAATTPEHANFVARLGRTAKPTSG
jgi:Uma2 family endonuclease